MLKFHDRLLILSPLRHALNAFHGVAKKKIKNLRNSYFQVHNRIQHQENNQFKCKHDHV